MRICVLLTSVHVVELTLGILMSYVQGTSSDQDNRFSDKNKRLMKTMKFADAIAKKVMCMILFANSTR